MANSVSHAELPYPIRNARFTVQLPYLASDGTPTDPTTPDTEISKDAGSFADCAEEVTTITGSNGVGYMTLSGAETDCGMAALAAKVASGPKPTLATLYPRRLPILESGTAQAGAAGTVTLASGAPAYDITGCFVRTTGGTGGGGTGGANNQARKIISYVTSTKVATIAPNWETNPSSDTTYDILLPEGMTSAAFKALQPTVPGRTLDVSTTGEAGLDWANIGAPTTTVALSGTTVDLVTDAVDASALATNAVAEITAAMKALVIETAGSVTLGQALSEILGAVLGVTTGGTFKTPDGTTVRAVVTYSGNDRTAVTLTPSA